MVGWHHLLNGHEFEQTPGDSEGQENWHAVVPGAAKSQTQKWAKNNPQPPHALLQPRHTFQIY